MKYLIILCALFTQMSFAGALKIENAWVKAVPKGSSMGAAYMEITNSSDKEVSLLKVATSFAETVEMHTHLHDNGVMKMRQVEKITIPAGGKATLKPMADHIMLIDVVKEIPQKGDLDFHLEFSNGEKIDLKIPVKKM